jgi:hypothetical protein
MRRRGALSPIPPHTLSDLLAHIRRMYAAHTVGVSLQLLRAVDGRPYTPVEFGMTRLTELEPVAPVATVVTGAGGSVFRLTVRAPAELATTGKGVVPAHPGVDVRVSARVTFSPNPPGHGRAGTLGRAGVRRGEGLAGALSGTRCGMGVRAGCVLRSRCGTGISRGSTVMVRIGSPMSIGHQLLFFLYLIQTV